ncbi:YidH family protein [Sulfitobacter pacificus]|uniref:YidH family protein n=1 Tax=Sulfitobacter pacificus TaxID=1499314 RepID=UPI003105E957
MPDTDLSNNPSSNELADTRTAWAEDRTILANERTFAGWMRTGMACIALALGLKAVFKDTSYPLIAKGVAEIFILVAILIFWAAVTKCRQAQKRMDDHDVEAQSHHRMMVLASVLTFGALATGVILWLL